VNRKRANGNGRSRLNATIAAGVADLAQVRCATHGVFDYKTAACPGCLNLARRRYEQLVPASARQRTRLFGNDAAPAPISAEALAVLRTEDPAGAAAVLSQLDRENRDYDERQREQTAITQDLASLRTTQDGKHRLGSPGSKYEGRLLGAVDLAGKRYARLRQSFLDGTGVICVPWIDAFAERVGRDIAVQWIDTSKTRASQ
jgi:hypothetical protein